MRRKLVHQSAYRVKMDRDAVRVSGAFFLRGLGFENTCFLLLCGEMAVEWFALLRQSQSSHFS